MCGRPPPSLSFLSFSLHIFLFLSPRPSSCPLSLAFLHIVFFPVSLIALSVSLFSPVVCISISIRTRCVCSFTLCWSVEVSCDFCCKSVSPQGQTYLPPNHPSTHPFIHPSIYLPFALFTLLANNVSSVCHSSNISFSLCQTSSPPSLSPPALSL